MRLMSILLMAPLLGTQVALAQLNDLRELESDLERQQRSSTNQRLQPERPLDPNLTDFSDLRDLAPFSDIAVIQRRFLPKTQRFQFNGALSTITNDPFFLSGGVTLRGAYHFTEAWGIELTYAHLGTAERDVTRGLRRRAVRTSSLVTPENWYGVDLMWTPIYGKQSYLNRRIVPFDLYFTAGLAATGTVQVIDPDDISRIERGVAPTLHLGTGQIFAITKAMAFRWDFSWNMYAARAFVDQAGEGDPANFQERTQTFNNLYLSFGFSFFFPEATYR